MDHRDFKTQIHEQFARVARAISNPHRLEILDLLAQAERSVDELAAGADLSIANTSQHLQVLRDGRLVESRRVGQRIIYRLAGENVFKLLQLVREVAALQLPEVDRIVDTYYRDRREFEPVTQAELLDRLRDPGLILLDVRPEAEYQHGHIAGARAIPVDQLPSRLNELPKEQEIVAYCRGRYCVFADEAVDILTANGYRARRFSEGFPDWKHAGLPVQS
jgi:rhodanese-related sulfurtransferase